MVTEETKLDELRSVCEHDNGEHMRLVTVGELRSLVACAEVLQSAYLYLNREDRTNAAEALRLLESKL